MNAHWVRGKERRKMKGTEWKGRVGAGDMGAAWSLIIGWIVRDVWEKRKEKPEAVTHLMKQNTIKVGFKINIFCVK